jgi:hypothetical protein
MERAIGKEMVGFADLPGSFHLPDCGFILLALFYSVLEKSNENYFLHYY